MHFFGARHTWKAVTSPRGEIAVCEGIPVHVVAEGKDHPKKTGIKKGKGKTMLNQCKKTVELNHSTSEY